MGFEKTDIVVDGESVLFRSGVANRSTRPSAAASAVIHFAPSLVIVSGIRASLLET